MFHHNELFFNCPNLIQLNCKNWQKKCDSCSAYLQENNQLFYLPVDKTIKHPIKLQKKEEFKNQLKKQRVINSNTQIVRNSKRGRKIEQQLINQVNKVIDCKSSTLSGALFKDGDAKLQIGESKYSAEIKSRTNSNLFGPSKKEWDKAIRQNVDVFITHSEEYGSFITMPLDIFLQIVNNEVN